MAEIKGKFLDGVEPKSPDSNVIWGKIMDQLSKIPDPLSEGEIAYLHIYFVEGTYIADGDIDSAKEIFENTKRIVGNSYADFEERHPDLFAAIDIAVRGDTNWGVEPAFKI